MTTQTQTQTGRAKHYNIVKSHTVVDRNADKDARRAIDATFHLTPATTAEMDNLLGLGTTVTTNKPDPVSKDEFGDWKDKEPTNAALRAIEKGK